MKCEQIWTKRHKYVKVASGNSIHDHYSMELTGDAEVDCVCAKSFTKQFENSAQIVEKIQKTIRAMLYE